MFSSAYVRVVLVCHGGYGIDAVLSECDGWGRAIIIFHAVIFRKERSRAVSLGDDGWIPNAGLSPQGLKTNSERFSLAIFICYRVWLLTGVRVLFSTAVVIALPCVIFV